MIVEILVTFGVLSAGGVAVNAVRRSMRPRSIVDLQSRLAEIDTEAFLNLIDPSEDAFLRRELPNSAYLRVRRMRIRAALAYLGQASANATLLLAYAAQGVTSSNAETALAAQQLAASAARFRLLALAARSRLCALWLFPASDMLLGDVMEGYERLRCNLQRAVAVDAPAISARVAAGL